MITIMHFVKTPKFMYDIRMRILFISPDIEEKARGINMILKSLIDSAKNNGHEVGMIVGYPNGSAFAKSEIISEKLEHLQAQHYIREGKDSFKYINNAGINRKAILKAALNLSVFKPKTIHINQTYLSGHKGMLNNIDFLVRSPYFYQFLVFGNRFIAQSLIKRIVKRNKVDLIIFASPSTISTRGLPCKVAHFVHDTMPIEIVETPPDNNTPARYARQFYSTCVSSDVIFTNSKDTASKVLEVNPDANVHVLYGTASSRKEEVETSNILESKGLKPQKYLLFTSTVEKRKNVSNLLSAYTIIAEKINMPLIIVGGRGYGFDEIYSQYEGMSEKLRKKIMFLGYVSEADKYALYNNAFAFVFPSVYEGIGLMLIEAMQAGLPVITSRRGALPEAGGDAALYVKNPYDPSEIANAIMTLYNDPALVKSMIEKGYKQQKNFTYEKFAARFAKAIATIQ